MSLLPPAATVFPSASSMNSLFSKLSRTSVQLRRVRRSALFRILSAYIRLRTNGSFIFGSGKPFKKLSTVVLL